MKSIVTTIAVNLGLLFAWLLCLLAWIDLYGSGQFSMALVASAGMISTSTIGFIFDSFDISHRGKGGD